MGALGLTLALAGAGCSSMHYPINQRLHAAGPANGYTVRNLGSAGNSDSLLVIVTFSGGGYRAAAMAYAALEVLDQTRIEWDGQQRTMLQELDVISSVSGGSLAAASFARDPGNFLQTFRPKVLDFDLQAALLSRAFSLSGLWRQTSATYGRGDLLQEVLDEHIFSGLTFADLPRRRPVVLINATHLRYGERFEFSQDQFDHLCSDLNPFPVARAVAASMAVPLLMSPITLWNHSRGCPSAPVTQPVRGRAAHSRYVHLVDGGLADNTGVDAVLENVAVHGGFAHAGRAHGFGGFRKRVFIVVNAQVNAEQAEDQSPDTPGLLRQLRSAVEVPIDRHSDASLKLLDEAVRQWRAELRTVGEMGSNADSSAFRIIEISMARPRDADSKDAVQQIPTGLAIKPEQIDLIRRFVRRELELNPEWQTLMRELQVDSLEARSLAPAALADAQLP